MGWAKDFNQVTANNMLISHLARERKIQKIEHPELFAREIAYEQAKATKATAKAEQKAARAAKAELDLMTMPEAELRKRFIFVWVLFGTLALLCTVSSPFGFVLGVPILAAVWNHQNKARARRADYAAERCQAEERQQAAEAERFLTDEDRDWMRRQSGQV